MSCILRTAMTCCTLICIELFPDLTIDRGCIMSYVLASKLALALGTCWVIVKTVRLVDLTDMLKKDCFGETRLVLHVPSSSRAGKRFHCCGLLLGTSLTKQKHVLLQGWTPMHYAAILDHHAVMIALLSQKATASPRDDSVSMVT